MLSLAGFVIANLIAASAPSYWWLAIARILLAVAAGLYVPNANAVASALAPAAYRGRALAIVNGGITVAVALGVPAGAFVGAHFGWRATLIGVAVLSAAALLVLAIRLPREIAAHAPAGLKARLAVIAMPGVFPTLVTTTLWATGAYTVYTYVSPLITSATGLSADTVGLVLTLSATTGAARRRCWPSSYAGVLSLNASFMYLGFSLGAALGSFVITPTSVAWIGAAGAACMLCAIAASAFAWRRSRT